MPRRGKIKLILYIAPDDAGRSLPHLYKALEFHAYNDYQLRIVVVTNSAEATVSRLPAIRRCDTELESIYEGDLSDSASIREKLGFNKR